MTQQEKEIELRRFFRNLLHYGVGNAVLILIWLLFDRGSFWPAWPLVVLGIPLLIEAIKLEIFPETYNKKAASAIKKVTDATDVYEDKFVGHMKELDKKAQKTTASVSEAKSKVTESAKAAEAEVKSTVEKAKASGAQKVEKAASTVSKTAANVGKAARPKAKAGPKGKASSAGRKKGPASTAGGAGASPRK